MRLQRYGVVLGAYVGNVNHPEHAIAELGGRLFDMPRAGYLERFGAAGPSDSAQK